MAARVPDADVIAAYEKYGHLGQAAASVGIHKSSLHERLVRLGVSTSKARAWKPADDDVLREEYLAHRIAGKVKELAVRLNRTVGAVTTRAYTLGLTDVHAPEALTALSEPEHYKRESEERYRAGQLLAALGAPDYRVAVIVLDGDPMSKARSRFARKSGAYTPPSVREAENRWIDRLSGIEPFSGNVAVACIFVRGSSQRIDVDNMLKLVMDACTRAKVWRDDSQVTGVAAVEELDPHEPRSVLALAPHTSTMRRGTDHWPACPTCGEQFNPVGKKKAVFCSAKCRAERRPAGKAA